MEISKKSNKIISIKKYIVDLVCTIVFWGGILRTNYNADTLTHMFSDDADVAFRVRDGRYVIAIIDSLLLRFGIRTTDNIRICEVITLLFIALAMFFLQSIFEKWEPKDNLAKVAYRFATAFVFLNVLFSEILMFSEMSIYLVLAYLLATVSIWLLIRKRYWISILLMIMSACTYQYAMVFSTIVLLFYLFIENELKISFKVVRKSVIAVIACFGCGLINLLSVYLLSFYGFIEPYRKDIEISNWGEKIGAFWKSQVDVFSSCYGLLPHLFIPVCALTIPLVVIVVFLVKEHRISDGIMFIALIIATILLMNSLPLMNKYYSFPGRMSFCIFLMIGLTYVASISIDKLPSIIRTILSVSLLCVILINMLFSQFILEDKYVSNTLDETYASIFIDELNEYEAESGNTVTKIVVGYDDYAPIYYDRVNFGAQQINERTMTIATTLITRYVSGRQFERLEMDELTRKRLFKNKNWDEINPKEQIIFIDDTAYWCMF